MSLKTEEKENNEYFFQEINIMTEMNMCEEKEGSGLWY